MVWSLLELKQNYLRNPGFGVGRREVPFWARALGVDEARALAAQVVELVLGVMTGFTYHVRGELVRLAAVGLLFGWNKCGTIC